MEEGIVKLIGVLNSKGGTGKSTITMALAVRATEDFQRVAIVDLDPQGSSTRWRGLRKAKYPEVLSGHEVASEALEGLQTTGWDIVFFDGLPGAIKVTADAVETVDLVLIPVMPGDMNIAASEPTIALCYTHKTDYLIVINGVQRANDRQAADTAAVLKELKQPIAETRIFHRAPYRVATDVGKSGPELDGGADSMVVKEIDALWHEVAARLHLTLKVPAVAARGGR
jgi:chromosome partitioning protein